MSKGVWRRFWRLSGVRNWGSPVSLVAAMSVAGGRAGQGPGRSPGRRGGAGGVLEVTGRVPDDLAAGNGSRDRAGGIFGCSGPSHGGSRGAGSAAGCSHPFACPRPAGPGPHGAGPRQKRRSGGVNQGGARAAGEGGGADTGRDLAPGRWPGRTVHAARAGGCVTGGSAGDLCRQRICPSRRP